MQKTLLKVLKRLRCTISFSTAKKKRIKGIEIGNLVFFSSVAICSSTEMPKYWRDEETENAKQHLWVKDSAAVINLATLHCLPRLAHLVESESSPATRLQLRTLLCFQNICACYVTRLAPHMLQTSVTQRGVLFMAPHT